MPEPLTWTEDVRPEWIDYNGHLSEGYYVLVFGFANDAAMVALGMTSDYLAETATSLFTLEAHVRYLDQVPPGARLEVRSSDHISCQSHSSLPVTPITEERTSSRAPGGTWSR